MLQRILAQAGDLALFAFVSLMFGLVKYFAMPDQANWKHQLGSIFVSVLVGTMAGALAMQWQFGDYTSLMASSVASLLSRDIVMAILINRRMLPELLHQAASNIVDKVTK